MTTIYLWVNAAIYGIFAILCTIKASATSKSIGFLSLNNGGMAEYVTVYGGMELGLGIIFAWLAWRPELHRTGIVLALALYAPLVVFRWISVARYWPVQGLTLGTGVLETTLLILHSPCGWCSATRFDPHSRVGGSGRLTHQRA